MGSERELRVRKQQNRWHSTILEPRPSTPGVEQEDHLKNRSSMLRIHPPREGGWETVDSWGNPGAPGGKHPYQHSTRWTQTQQHLNTGHSSMSDSDESIQLLEAVAGKPVRFKLNNPQNHNDAWVGIYQTGAPDQDHGAQNQRWKYIRDIDVNNVSLSNGGGLKANGAYVSFRRRIHTGRTKRFHHPLGAQQATRRVPLLRQL